MSRARLKWRVAAIAAACYAAGLAWTWLGLAMGWSTLATLGGLVGELGRFAAALVVGMTLARPEVHDE